MATTSSSRIPHLPSPKISHSGRNIGNQILLSLPPDEAELITPQLELVRLKIHQILHEAGDRVGSGFFVNDGLQSVVSIQPDGRSVEVGLIGKEGFVGIALLGGFRTSPTRVVTQRDGTAYRIEAHTLEQLLPRCPRLQLELHRFGQCLTMQSMQIAACNRLHDVEERLARCLLMRDGIGSDKMPLTQDFLAQMLGTRRASVSVAAGVFQKAGMIAYTRGNVTITDRAKLEDAACTCYLVIQRQLKNWRAEAA